MDDSIGGSQGVTGVRVQRTARPYGRELLDLRISQVSHNKMMFVFVIAVGDLVSDVFLIDLHHMTMTTISSSIEPRSSNAWQHIMRCSCVPSSCMPIG